MYQRLPECPAATQPETVVDHGARVLRFILETRVTATLTDLDLERALLASQYCISARDIAIVHADRLHEIRRLIDSTQRARKSIAPAELPSMPALGIDSRPNAGPMAPLAPAPTPNPIIPAARVKPVIQF